MFASLFSASAGAPALLDAARAFSPRVEAQFDGRLVIVDASGLGRIVGDAETIARELRASAGGEISIAVAPTRTAAILLAMGCPGTTVVAPGRTAAAVGALGLEVFERLARVASAKQRPCALCALALGSRRRARTRCGEPGGACTELPTLRRWGLTTLGAFAALPAADLSARLGQPGVALQRLARGLDAQPLVPAIDEPRFEASFDFEWPIEDLQPLSFVLTRLLEPLSAALERADRGASAIVTELALVRSTTPEARAATHVRRLELPAPMREPRVLRTLILLDLESHPPAAAVERLTVRLEPTPGRIVQFSLLERAGPQPETIATLVARLTALMGEQRVGAPALVDSHRPGAFELTPFGSEVGGQSLEVRGQIPVLRRFRLPVPARVHVECGRPARVTTDRAGIAGGAVKECSGPWRSSGDWWSARGPREAAERSPAEPDRRARASGGGAPRAGRKPARGPREAAERSPAEPDRRARASGGGAWSRDEYDVSLDDGAAYRIYRDRHDGAWFIEGILD